MSDLDALRAEIEALPRQDSPQWEDCKVCGGDHWTKDHMPAVRPAGLDWPTLANIIREVDGNHDLGAGELAERILAHPKFRAMVS